MANLFEVRDRRSSHPLGRRVGTDDLRVFRFQVDELAVEAVVLGVTDRGFVQDVIRVIVGADVLAEFYRLLLNVLWDLCAHF